MVAEVRNPIVMKEPRIVAAYVADLETLVAMRQGCGCPSCICEMKSLGSALAHFRWVLNRLPEYDHAVEAAAAEAAAFRSSLHEKK